MPRVHSVIFVLLMLVAGSVQADRVETVIEGVDGELLTNVRSYLSLYQARNLENLSIWRIRGMSMDAEEEVRQALRPFGYYSPDVRVRLEDPQTEGAPYRAQVRIGRGEPVLVEQLDIRIVGEGESDRGFQRWKRDWPLQPGDRLRHSVYSEYMQELNRLATRQGYFGARFSVRRLEVDPERRVATVRIEYNTGDRFRLGEFIVPEKDLRASVVDRLVVLEPGEPYSVDEINHQRDVLVRSGYYDRVVIDELRRPEDSEVDLDYDLEMREPNTYQATLGYGTDTGPRLQLGWLRHYLSDRGDRLDLAFGVQERNSEYVLRGDYRLPRGQRPGDFYTSDALFRRERDSFRFNDENRLEPVFEGITGTRLQGQVSVGRMQERAVFRERYEPLRERIFISWLSESFDAFREAAFTEEQAALVEANPELVSYLDTEAHVPSLGAEWNLVNVSGSGFYTSGEHYQFRLRGAHESLGSDVGFAQAYLGARFHWLLSDRHKLLVRGELGYTEADVDELTVSLEDRELDLSLTTLPELYRFKTGGDRTVRGYAFERLSTNRNGANHLMVGSLEYEYRVGEDWSLATFFDIGNAFNDFNEPNLRRGVGVGFRWYTMIGPVQLDVARALDDTGQPWRLHFTIGTTLL